MPIPYDKLTYNDILHNQAAYERFDKAGKELFLIGILLALKKRRLVVGIIIICLWLNRLKKFLIFLVI